MSEAAYDSEPGAENSQTDFNGEFRQLCEGSLSDVSELIKATFELIETPVVDVPLIVGGRLVVNHYQIGDPSWERTGLRSGVTARARAIGSRALMVCSKLKRPN